MRHPYLKTVWIIVITLAITCVQLRSRADAAGDKKRAQLLNVKRLLVVPMFFGTDTLGELSPARPGAPSDTKHESKSELDDKQQAALTDYLEMLRKLERNAGEQLPARAAARTTYEVIKSGEVERALNEFKITPPGLYQTGGRLTSRKFDLPDSAQIKRLAIKMQADAVLLGVLDEPRKSNGGYYFDPITGPGYDSPKVHDKATFDLLLADGTLVLRQTIDVVHPLTRIGTRQFVLADWIETDDQIIEDFMDELTRYTPKR